MRKILVPLLGAVSVVVALVLAFTAGADAAPAKVTKTVTIKYGSVPTGNPTIDPPTQTLTDDDVVVFANTTSTGYFVCYQQNDPYPQEAPANGTSAPKGPFAPGTVSYFIVPSDCVASGQVASGTLQVSPAPTTTTTEAAPTTAPSADVSTASEQADAASSSTASSSPGAAPTTSSTTSTTTSSTTSTTSSTSSTSTTAPSTVAASTFDDGGGGFPVGLAIGAVAAAGAIILISLYVHRNSQAPPPD